MSAAGARNTVYGDQFRDCNGQPAELLRPGCRDEARRDIRGTVPLRARYELQQPHVTIKDKFLPAADSLRWLAPTFVFAYANVLLWLAPMILDRSWTITIVSIAGLVLLPILIVLAVPLFAPLGPGGAGMGVAIALSARELVIMLVFLAFCVTRPRFSASLPSRFA